MYLASAVAESMARAGLTQQQLAHRTNVDRSLIAKVVAGGRTATPEFVAAAVRATGDLSLAYQMCASCPVGILKSLPLNPDAVDFHPVTVACKLAEELREAQAALQALNLVNKRQAADLDATDRERLERALQELWDLIPGLQTFVQVCHERYDINPWEMRRTHEAKLKARKYAAK